MTPSQLAAKLGYIPMTRAFDEVETAGLGEVVMEWRARVLRFEGGEKELWGKSKKQLRSLVCKRI